MAKTSVPASHFSTKLGAYYDEGKVTDSYMSRANALFGRFKKAANTTEYDDRLISLLMELDANGVYFKRGVYNIALGKAGLIYAVASFDPIQHGSTVGVGCKTLTTEQIQKLICDVIMAVASIYASALHRQAEVHELYRKATTNPTYINNPRKRTWVIQQAQTMLRDNRNFIDPDLESTVLSYMVGGMMDPAGKKTRAW